MSETPLKPHHSNGATHVTMTTETEGPPQQERAAGPNGHGKAEPATSPEAPAKTKSRRRPPRALLIGGSIVAIFALILGIRHLLYASSHQTTDDAKVDADTVTVTSKINEKIDRILVDTNEPVHKGQVIIRLDDRDERAALAQAQAALEAQRAQAVAAQRNVDLTRAQQQAQTTQGTGGIASAQASIANARAQAASARQQAEAAQAAIATSQAQLRATQSQVPAEREALTRANTDLARYISLARDGDIPQQKLDAQRATQAQAAAQYRSALDNVVAAQASVTQAQARFTAAIASANAAQAGIGSQEGQLQTSQGKLAETITPHRVTYVAAQARSAAAQVAQLEAQVKSAQDKLSYTVIRSPIDGYVGAKNVEVGASVQSGQSLMNLVPNTRIYITANYKETQLGKVRVGQRVDVDVDTYKGTPFRGHVSAIAPATQNTFAIVPAQNSTGNFVKITQRIPVRILVDDAPADKPLRVGMSVGTSIKVK